MTWRARIFAFAMTASALVALALAAGADWFSD